MTHLDELEKEIIRCKKCPRLVKWRELCGRVKKPAFAQEPYWAKPVPAFGDARARLWIVGLAPAAHGGNRTGRMFTGDRSGEWLYRALYRAGFSNREQSVARDDGLKLRDAWISAVVRCAPPDNKPSPQERDHCLPYLEKEFLLLDRVEVVLALGKFAWDGVLQILSRQGAALRPRPKFGHGAEFNWKNLRVLGSYHPSQQNTFTGKLTEAMFDAVFLRAKQLLGSGK